MDTMNSRSDLEPVPNIYDPQPPSAPKSPVAGKVLLQVGNYTDYLKLVLKSAEYQDLLFVCSDGELWAHRLVVICASPLMGECMNDQVSVN
jgi:hypothetical protein